MTVTEPVTEIVKPKPLWWRIVRPGKLPNKWHQDPMASSIGHRLLRGDMPLMGRCNFGDDSAYHATDSDIQVRRTAPPVANQCKRCRAAKAKQRKVSK